ncbi:MAG: chromate transporter [Clostridia bacterium]|nr:chromate transporter [Clostridia bacterium]
MSRERNAKTLLNLFLQCLRISAFTFGGGSAIIALFQQQFVEKLKWTDSTEMLEMITMAQSIPGATSVNVAALMGHHLFGAKGMAVAALGAALPPLIVITVITAFYDWLCANAAVANALRGVRACAAALVASVSLSLLIALFKKREWFLIAVWACAAAAVLCFRVKALPLMLAGLIVSFLSALIARRGGKEG